MASSRNVLTRPWRKVLKLLNIQVNVDDVGKKATVTLPNMSAEDIDRTGNFNICRLQNLMTIARFAAYHIPNMKTGKTFLEYDTLTENYYTFMASVETVVTKEFYDLTNLEEWPGLRVSFQLGYLGSASLNTIATLEDAATGRVLAGNTNSVVCVDMKTRKPAPLPDWWKNKYKDAVIGQKKLHVLPFDTPDDAYCYQMKVPWSQVDAYKHTNYISYIQFCLDAAMDAMTKERLDNFGGDIYEHCVEKLQLLYVGECSAGDVVDIFVWQDSADHNLLFFSMYNEKKNIFQSKMHFFPLD